VRLSGVTAREGRRYEAGVPEQEPRVSVLLPARDAAATLEVAIESIRGQSEQRWELLVVDDGSTDTTAAVAEKQAGADGRVRLLRQPARGIVAALNHALARARAPLIARMDADDRSRPERLAEQCAYLDAHEAIGLVSCRVHYAGDRAAHAGYAAYVDWLNTLTTPEAIGLSRFVESPVAHPSVVFRRQFCRRFGAWRAGAFPEDYELWLRWLEAGVRFAKVEATLLDWADPPERLSRVDARYGQGAFYRLKCAYLKKHLRHTPGPGRPLWLWGAGRQTRRRFRPLEEAMGGFAGYVDIDPKKIGQRIAGAPVVGPEAIPEAAFVLLAVGSRGARELCRERLTAAGRREGADFLAVA
jgi:glycosyltransferase involved in cell wall biosynthesis